MKMTMRRVLVLVVMSAALAVPGVARADTIVIGALSFSTSIAPDAYFVVFNSTDVAFAHGIDFTGLVVTTSPDAKQYAVPATPFQDQRSSDPFHYAQAFLNGATLTGRLDLLGGPWLIQLADFSWFRIADPTITAVLSSGQAFLEPDGEFSFADITVTGSSVQTVVPEPGTLLLVATGLAVSFRARKRHRS
ncbi:MAG TPA: PEP-CTERM sorting domain-containing protein [Propionicimonas sp.]|jgi:hypothetical protein